MTGKKRSTTEMDELDHWFEHGIDLKSRTIYIGNAQFDYDDNEMGVDALMAEWAIKGLHKLDRENNNLINIILNTIGGDWYHGMAIYDAIIDCKSRVRITGTGNVMSMGAVILQAGDERVLTPNATMMIHHGYLAINQRYTDALKWAEHEEKLSHVMADIFAERSEHDSTYWYKICQDDTIYTAEEAVEEGLADRVR